MFDLDWPPHPPPDFLSVHPWRRGRGFAPPRGHCMLRGYTLQSGLGCCSLDGFHKPQAQSISSAGKHTHKKVLFHVQLENTHTQKRGYFMFSWKTHTHKKMLFHVQLENTHTNRVFFIFSWKIYTHKKEVILC